MHPEKRLSNVERLVGYALVLGAAALGVALVAVAMSLTGCGNIVIDLTPDWSDVVDTVPDLPEPDDASTPHDDGGSLDTLDVASEDTTADVEDGGPVDGAPCPADPIAGDPCVEYAGSGIAGSEQILHRMSVRLYPGHVYHIDTCDSYSGVPFVRVTGCAHSCRINCSPYGVTCEVGEESDVLLEFTTAVGYRSEWNWQVRGGPCEVVE